MTKPFLFLTTTIQVSDGSLIKSWELINTGDSSLMHAAWNPEKQLLVCQFNSVKENLRAIPVPSKNGKSVNYVDKRIHEYYRITVEDKEAVKYILENMTANYVGQEWEIVHVSEKSKVEIPTEAMID